jgi:hypothetical protein
VDWCTAFLAIVVGMPHSTREEHGEVGTLHLTPNATRLLQQDVLLVRTTFHNPSRSVVHLEAPDGELRGYFIRIQVYEEGHWRILRSDSELSGGYGVAGGRPVGPEVTFAEYLIFHKHRDKFTFDRPGTYRLRAVTRASGVEVTSNTVEIHVDKRKKEDLDVIEGLGELSEEFKFVSLEPKKAEFFAVKRVGGNIGATIGLFETLREFSTKRRYQGEPITTPEFCAALRREYDEVSYGKSLELLAYDVQRQGDLKSLLFLVNTLGYESNTRGDLADFLRAKGLRPEEPAGDLPESSREKEMGGSPSTFPRGR